MVLAILTLSPVIIPTVVVWTSLQITSDLSHMYFQQSRILTYHMHVFPAELDFDLFTCVYFQPSLILTNHLCVFSAQLDDAGPGWLPASPTAGQQDTRVREGRVPAEEE